MKEHNKTTHCKSGAYSMENMENPEVIDEESGVWDKTKEGVAKAWSATKEGAAKAWDKTKEVTEDITGFGHHDDDEGAYFEEESIIDNHGRHLHHTQGFTKSENHYADFSETDGDIPHNPAHQSPETSKRHTSPNA